MTYFESSSTAAETGPPRTSEHRSAITAFLAFMLAELVMAIVLIRAITQIQSD